MHPKSKPAQVAASRKAAALKVANAAAKPKPPHTTIQQVAQQNLASHVAALAYAAQEEGPPRLLTKNQVLARIGVTFPTVWAWMRAGDFPRAVVVGNKSMWHEQEINAWITALPRRALKGDTEEVA
jgi:predicted DNA-binding transcriptional regulator AlpA